jgi:hypothetical protein
MKPIELNAAAIESSCISYQPYRLLGCIDTSDTACAPNYCNITSQHGWLPPTQRVASLSSGPQFLLCARAYSLAGGQST